MSKYICSIYGVRGRSIDIYDNKCVITTDVTIGSVLTRNATDGEKTIFYIDVTGVQFKESGVTIGYLQFETASSQMNNRNDNFFSENTFTFDASQDAYMRRVYEFVVARIEGYKYGTINEALTDIPEVTERERLMAEKQKQLMQAQEERLELEKQAEEKRIQELRENVLQNKVDENIMASFIEQAVSLRSMVEILKLWNALPDEYREKYSEISSKLENSAKSERLYGKDEKSIERFFDWLKELLAI